MFAFARFFFLLFFSFPGKGFFVATFCMRSILFAGSNREKKIASLHFSSLLSSHSTRSLRMLFLHNYKRKVSFSLCLSLSLSSSPPRECVTRACSTCLHKKEISFFLTNHFLARYWSVSSFESTNDEESNIVFTITPIKVGGLDIMTVGTTGELSWWSYMIRLWSNRFVVRVVSYTISLFIHFFSLLFSSLSLYTLYHLNTKEGRLTKSKKKTKRFCCLQQNSRDCFCCCRFVYMYVCVRADRTSLACMCHARRNLVHSTTIEDALAFFFSLSAVMDFFWKKKEKKMSISILSIILIF